MTKNLLVISNYPDSAWLQTVGDALRSLGKLQVAAEHQASVQIKVQDYDLLILDATAISGDIAALVAWLHEERPDIPIVVATTSPTWQRARQVFMAGASDYIRRSLDRERTLASFRDVLARSLSQPSPQDKPREEDHV